MKPNILAALILAGTAMVGGCASIDSPGDRYDNSGSRYDDGGSRNYGARSNEGYYGVVESIESTPGAGNNNAVAGAVGGAVVGHEIGKGNPDPDTYRLRIRFDNGDYQTVTQASIGDLRVGDGVRIENGRVHRY